MDRDFARGGELDRVRDEVRERLADATRVAEHALGQVRGDVDHELELLRRGRGRLRRRHFLDVGAQVHLDALELELAGLDLRVVEQVVDDDEQGIGARADHVRVLALAAVEVGVEQERRHADHAVHRRAHLVAHVRQELAAGAARGLRLRARLGERLAQFRELLLKFRDVRAGGHSR